MGGQATDVQAWQHLEQWRLGPDAGRRYGSINGDLNPIHLHPLASRLFGFKRPIAHALLLLTQAEACLRRQGARSWPSPLSCEPCCAP